MTHSKSNNPVVRMAPSPTGNFHVGSARTALFNYLFAKQNGGKFILRIEDTDKERSKKEYEQNILDGLEWLDLPYDEMYRQSERTDIYKSELNKLLASGAVYISKEEIKKEGDRSEVIRFKNPNKKITFQDEVRGEVSFDTTELGDFVVAKSLEEPLYHLAVVVDDFLSGVTHVIRGEDHISNTPRQILIQEALGAPRPVYGHLPLLLGADRSKLSKRNGETSLAVYRDRGYLPEAMNNFLAFLGFNPGTEQEIYTLAELIKVFDLNKVHKGGAIFDEEKLKWMNGEHLKLKGEKYLNNYLAEALKEYPESEKLAQLFSDRITVASDLADEFKRGEWQYLFEKPQYEPALLVWKKDDTTKTLTNFDLIISSIENIDFDADKNTLQNALNEKARAVGNGSFFWPLRTALSGREKSPDPVSLMLYFGKDETLARLNDAKHALTK